MFVKGIQFPGFYFAPDDAGDGGSGGNGGAESEGEGSGTPSDNGGKGNGDPPSAGQEGDKGGKEGEGGKKPVQFTPEQQAEIDRIAAKARTDGKRIAEQAAKEAKLREEGKFKDLHEAQEKRIKEELEPAAALATELAAEVNTSIDDEVKEWPDSLKKTDPGKDDVKARLKWVRNSRDLAKDLRASKQAPNGEHGSGGGGSDKGATPAAILRPGFRVPGGKK